jgi:5'-nucleotidase
MLTRRKFIQHLSLSAAGLIASPYLFAKNFDRNSVQKITILHTNDMHSHIEPFSSNDPKYPGLGGMSTRAKLIQHIRNQEKNVVLLDAGDIFQGTPYFNLFGGELEFKLMSEMKYDAATLGNHDFDNGLEGLKKMLPHAQFPFVNANYDFSQTILNNHFKPYTIINKNNIKIGVLGVGIELSGLVDKKNYENTIYLDPIHKANEIAAILKNEEKCDLIICLSHLGYKYDSNKISDTILAQENYHIDCIIGGHTHTFIDTPVIFKNKSGKKTVISQAGWAGIKLGRLDFFIQKKNNEPNIFGYLYDVNTQF